MRTLRTVRNTYEYIIFFFLDSRKIIFFKISFKISKFFTKVFKRCQWCSWRALGWGHLTWKLNMFWLCTSGVIEHLISKSRLHCTSFSSQYVVYLCTRLWKRCFFSSDLIVRDLTEISLLGK